MKPNRRRKPGRATAMPMRRRHVRWLLAAAGMAGAAAGLALLFGWPGSSPPMVEMPVPIAAVPLDPAQVALGARVYASACASCHGANLEGQPDWQSRNAAGRLPAPPHDETGHSWHHPDEFLFMVTKYGVGPFAGPNYESDMPAFEATLADEKIRAVIAYIKSRWPEPIRARQASNDAAFRAEQP